MSEVRGDDPFGGVPFNVSNPAFASGAGSTRIQPDEPVEELEPEIVEVLDEPESEPEPPVVGRSRKTSKALASNALPAMKKRDLRSTTRLM